MGSAKESLHLATIRALVLTFECVVMDWNATDIGIVVTENFIAGYLLLRILIILSYKVTLFALHKRNAMIGQNGTF